MGYYDFDEHFWSPQEVCGQTRESLDENRFSFIKKILEPILTAWGGNKDGINTLVLVKAYHRHFEE